MEVRASLGKKRHSSPPPRRARLPLPDRQSHKEDEVWAQSCCCAPRSPKRWTAHPRLGISWKGCCCSCPHDESACKYSLILHEGVRFLLRSSAVRARGQGSRLDRRCSSPVPLSPPSLSRGGVSPFLGQRCVITAPLPLLLQGWAARGCGPVPSSHARAQPSTFFFGCKGISPRRMFFFCHFLCVEPAPAPLSGVRTDMTDLLDHEPGEPKDEDSLTS